MMMDHQFIFSRVKKNRNDIRDTLDVALEHSVGTELD